VARVVNKHQSWRLISCIWLHAGVFHVVANMLSLLLIGIRLEQEFGFCMYFTSVVNFVRIICLLKSTSFSEDHNFHHGTCVCKCAQDSIELCSFLLFNVERNVIGLKYL
jgi:membrane associated rhomboid family serine protease